jgi:hypothetical protein
VLTNLLDSLHKVMLTRIAQALDPVDDILVVLALNGNRNRELAHDQRLLHTTVLRHGLQVGNFERRGVLVEDIGEVLNQQSIEPFESVEA